MAAKRRRLEESSVDAAEVAQFDALAETWWDADGPMRPLHRLNPVRLKFIRSEFVRHFELERDALEPFRNLRIIDVGCGGGILSEPIARLGAEVTGIDVSSENVGVARSHAADGGLKIDYRVSSAEALAATDQQFDAVVSMEVVEHVADLGSFLTATASLVRPGGAMILATLNRTAKSYALAILGAEYLLRWLPRGTHRWDRFVKPAEMRRHLDDNGLMLSKVVGVGFDPVAGDWRLSGDKAVNYMGFGVKI